MNLPNYLDNLINSFYDKKNNYPTKIIMSLDCYNKLISVCKEIDISNSWIDFPEKNYRGIDIEFREVETITMEE